MMLLQSAARQISIRRAPELSCGTISAAPDLSRRPEEVVALYDDGTEAVGDLVYVPKNLSAEKGLAGC